jgi:hypothetical protein
MRAAVRNSILSAYYWFGFPDKDRRTPCLNTLKWDPIAAADMIFLGFHICTRSMTVAWPVPKRLALATLLDTHCLARPCRLSVKLVATILGTVRNAAYVAPIGVFLSLRLQHVLNTALIKRPMAQHTLRRWWSASQVLLPQDALEDLALLRAALSSEPDDPTWRRPIGLLVARSPTGSAKSDASYQGIGGWSPTFKFMWRLSRQDLLACGFLMRPIDSHTGEPTSSDPRGLHINILEFPALTINVWFVIKAALQQGPHPGGHILILLTDNTSALSWLHHAARSHSPPVRRLARLISAFFLFNAFPLTLQG